MDSKWAITLLIVTLLAIDRVGGGRKIKKANAINRRIVERIESSKEAGSSGRVDRDEVEEREGTSIAGGEPLDESSTELAESESDIQMMHEDHLEEFAKIFAAHWTLEHFKKRMAGKPSEKLTVDSFQITLQKFKYEGRSETIIEKKEQHGLWVKVEEIDFALCAQLKIQQKGKKDGGPKSTVCARPSNGRKLVFEISFDLSLQNNNTEIMDIKDDLVMTETPKVESVVWKRAQVLVQDTMTTRLCLELMHILSSGEGEVSDRVQQMPQIQGKAMVPVKVGSDVYVTE